jgi:hypothetical protein
METTQARTPGRPPFPVARSAASGRARGVRDVRATSGPSDSNGATRDEQRGRGKADQNAVYVSPSADSGKWADAELNGFTSLTGRETKPDGNRRRVESRWSLYGWCLEPRT